MTKAAITRSANTITTPVGLVVLLVEMMYVVVMVFVMKLIVKLNAVPVGFSSFDYHIIGMDTVGVDTAAAAASATRRSDPSTA